MINIVGNGMGGLLTSDKFSLQAIVPNGTILGEHEM